MSLLVTVEGPAQTALDVKTTLIVELVARDVVVYVAPVAPVIIAPLRLHWKVGAVPPLIGVAVKVTGVPALVQIDVEDADIVTKGIKVGLTTTEVVPAILVQPLTVTVTL